MPLHFLLQRTDLKLLTASQKSDIYLTKAELLLAGLAATDGSAYAEHGGASSEEVSAALASSIYMHAAQPKAWLLWASWCDGKGTLDVESLPLAMRALWPALSEIASALPSSAEDTGIAAAKRQRTVE